MSKKDTIELTGVVTDVLPSSMFKVQVDDYNAEILCYLGGKLKQHKIKIIVQDKVKIEMSPYDLTRGRITYRL